MSILDEVRQIIGIQFDTDWENVSAETNIYDDLNADSLDTVEIVMALEEEFDIEDIADTDAMKFKTVQDIVDYLKGHGVE